jgi:hypothetical protein
VKDFLAGLTDEQAAAIVAGMKETTALTDTRAWLEDLALLAETPSPDEGKVHRALESLTRVCAATRSLSLPSSAIRSFLPMSSSSVFFCGRVAA